MEVNTIQVKNYVTARLLANSGSCGGLKLGMKLEHDSSRLYYLEL